jgi:hypothetical protein
MSEEHRPSKKTQLALAVAQGESVAEWARTNEVPRRTAFRWAKEVSVRTAVESFRRRSIDRAVGRMAGRANWAVKGITTLAAGAESESVRLRALRAMLSDMMAVAKFSGLEQRMTQIEVQLNERVGNAGRPG